MIHVIHERPIDCEHESICALIRNGAIVHKQFRDTHSRTSKSIVLGWCAIWDGIETDWYIMTDVADREIVRDQNTKLRAGGQLLVGLYGESDYIAVIHSQFPMPTLVGFMCRDEKWSQIDNVGDFPATMIHHAIQSGNIPDFTTLVSERRWNQAQRIYSM